MVGREDLVLVDRNCHKSILHSIIMTGAIPLYLTPERNELGIIGPIPLSEFSKESIAAKIAASPLARPRAEGEAGGGDQLHLRRPVLQRRADQADPRRQRRGVALRRGLVRLCRVPRVLRRTLWHGHLAQRGGPLVFATHSTHKMLAAFSQASMIHVQDGGTRKLDVARFNEAFMMHISTSPQYGIIASLDVASAMMEGPAGRSLIQETFDEALSFRRAWPTYGRTWTGTTGGSASGSRSRWRAPIRSAPMTGCWSRAPTGTASAISPKTTCCSTRSRSP